MTSSDDVILEVRDTHKAYGGVVAVDVDHLQLQRGVLTSLIGPNGAGKTTFFDVLTGFTAPERGSVELDGRPILGKAPWWIARRGMVRTFQLTKALDKMTVVENMMLAAIDQPGERLPWMFLTPGRIRRRDTEIRAKAEELLERFQLTRLSGEYAGRLSGGQKKLLELARALMVEPKLVLLDEPMAGVNPALGEQLLHYVEELRQEGTTFLLVEHDLEVVMRVSERVIVMDQGRIIADGPPDIVRTDQKVIDAYLGTQADEQIARHRERS